MAVPVPALGVPVPHLWGSFSSHRSPCSHPWGSHPHHGGPCSHPEGAVPIPRGPIPTLRVHPTRGSVPRGPMFPILGILSPPPGPCPHRGGPIPTRQGLHSHSGSACPRADILSLGILPQQSQFSAFPQSPPHTTSASGAFPHSHPVCPFGTCWVCPLPGVCVALGDSRAGNGVLWVLSPQPCQVSFQEGPQGGGPQDRGPPTVPSPLGCPLQTLPVPRGDGGDATPRPPNPSLRLR